MDLSGQQNQVPQHAPQPVPSPVPTAASSTNGLNSLQNPIFGYAQQPAASQVTESAGYYMPSGQQASTVTNGASQIPVAPGVPATPQPQPVQAYLNDDLTDVNDTQWVNRAKHAIASTHGDPHRQVQLIQHLRSQYLKQRFGRTVHTDGA